MNDTLNFQCTLDALSHKLNSKYIMETPPVDTPTYVFKAIFKLMGQYCEIDSYALKIYFPHKSQQMEIIDACMDIEYENPCIIFEQFRIVENTIIQEVKLKPQDKQRHTIKKKLTSL
jgi:hypothetical protein